MHTKPAASRRAFGRGRSGTAQRARSPELPTHLGSTAGLQAKREKGTTAEMSTKPPALKKPTPAAFGTGRSGTFREQKV